MVRAVQRGDSVAPPAPCTCSLWPCEHDGAPEWAPGGAEYEGRNGPMLTGDLPRAADSSAYWQRTIAGVADNAADRQPTRERGHVQ
jgi:hypothetical protein